MRISPALLLLPLLLASYNLPAMPYRSIRGDALQAATVETVALGSAVPGEPRVRLSLISNSHDFSHTQNASVTAISAAAPAYPVAFFPHRSQADAGGFSSSRALGLYHRLLMAFLFLRVRFYPLLSLLA